MNDSEPPAEEPVESRADLTPSGARKIGRYVQHYLLGRGGMGSVYLCRLVGAEGFERWVAVKQLHDHLADDPATVTMFLDEARTTAKLSHPNVVQVTDFGAERGRPFLVMEYVSGENLSALNHRCRKAGTHLPYPLAVRIIAWACEGLHHAHELRDKDGEPLSLVHRDVSPQNILVSYDGVVKVTDFGIAKVAHRAGVHTRTGQLKGKAAYMAPEQVQGLAVDRRADVFALGIVLFETTVGQRLFHTDNEFEILRRIKEAEVPLPSTLDPEYPEALERIVLRALAARPEDRYQTSREMQRELEQYLMQCGELVGSAELADHMERVFGERKRLRESKLRALPDELETIPISHSGLDLKPSLRSVPPMMPGSSLTSIPRAPRRPWPLLAAVAVGSLVVGGLAVWATLGGAWSGRGQEPAPPPLAQARATALDEPEAGAEASPAGAVAADAAPAAPTADADAPPADVAPAGEPPDASPPTKRPADRPRTPPPAGPPGTLSIMASPWCEVLLDGRPLGRTPIIRRQVPSGRHSLRLLPMGQGPATRRSIVVRPGEETPINVTLPP